MYKTISEIKSVIESLERSYNIIQRQLDPNKESFSTNLSQLNGIQARIEELLFEGQIITLLNQSKIKILN